MGGYPLSRKEPLNSTTSDYQTFHKAITYREIYLEKGPLSKMVLGICSQTEPTEPQDSPKQRDTVSKYLTKIFDHIRDTFPFDYTVPQRIKKQIKCS